MSNPTTTAKFELLRDLLDLSRAQHGALEADDLDRFEALMLERTEILQDLGLLDSDGAPLPPNVLEFPVPLEIARDDALALDSLIQGILEQDQRNEQLLSEHMAVIRAELPRLAGGQRATSAYRMNERPSTFIDRVS